MLSILVFSGLPTDEASRVALRRHIAASSIASRIVPGSAPAYDSGALSSLSSLACIGSTCKITANTTSGEPARLRLQFFSPTVVRFWLSADGSFDDDGAAADVLVGKPESVAVAAPMDKGDHWEIASPNVTVRLHKARLQLTLVDNTAGRVVFAEQAPLAWNQTSCWQTSARDTAAPLAPGLSAEYYFGGGMQNGRWSHRGATITISRSFDWDDGGNPNPSPWYLSTAGVGVLRNTCVSWNRAGGCPFCVAGTRG